MDELNANNHDELYHQYHASAVTSRENSHDDEGFEVSYLPAELLDLTYLDYLICFMIYP